MRERKLDAGASEKLGNLFLKYVGGVQTKCTFWDPATYVHF